MFLSLLSLSNLFLKSALLRNSLVPELNSVQVCMSFHFQQKKNEAFNNSLSSKKRPTLFEKCNLFFEKNLKLHFLFLYIIK